MTLCACMKIAVGCVQACCQRCVATGSNLAQQRLLFYGAGEAGTGIAELIAIALHRRHGLSVEDVSPLLQESCQHAQLCLQIHGGVGCALALCMLLCKCFCSPRQVPTTLGANSTVPTTFQSVLISTASSCPPMS